MPMPMTPLRHVEAAVATALLKAAVATALLQAAVATIWKACLVNDQLITDREIEERTKKKTNIPHPCRGGPGLCSWPASLFYLHQLTT
jgi:hypothetical protein